MRLMSKKAKTIFGALAGNPKTSRFAMGRIKIPDLHPLNTPLKKPEKCFFVVASIQPISRYAMVRMASSRCQN